jgi:hypothetical protein
MRPDIPDSANRRRHADTRDFRIEKHGRFIRLLAAKRARNERSNWNFLPTHGFYARLAIMDVDRGTADCYAANTNRSSPESFQSRFAGKVCRVER